MNEEKQLLSINDAMRLTGRSRRTVLRWFENEPGVILVLDNPETMHKRRYRTFRIPRAVFEKVVAAKPPRVLTAEVRTYPSTVNGKATPEYDAYSNALQRCQNPKNARYSEYGGRGITFEFVSFQQFMGEVGPRPTPNHSLDRILNEGNYEPGTVRWATPEQQRASRRPRGLSETKVTVYVRHSRACPHRGDEFFRECDCPKHVRWSQRGKQHRESTGTRTWAAAMAAKTILEDQLQNLS